MAKKIPITEMEAVIFVKPENVDDFTFVGETTEDRTIPKFFENEKKAEDYIKNKVSSPIEIKIYALRKYIKAAPQVKFIFEEIDIKNLSEDIDDKEDDGNDEAENNTDLG